jgi:hypothetical protein
MQTSNAVTAAITARNVVYWNTRKGDQTSVHSLR